MKQAYLLPDREDMLNGRCQSHQGREWKLCSYLKLPEQDASEASNFRRMVSQLSAPGAGSVLTSTEDMGKWLINFDTAKVGGKKALAMMQRSGKLNNGADVEYGFGICVSKWSRYRGMTVLSHRGDWAGYIVS